LKHRSLRLLLPALAACACAPGADASSYDSAAASAAAATITSSSILAHVQTLASDDYEGRAPGTPGEQRTTDYLIGEFMRLGLEPGNVDGTWLQPVALRGMRATSRARFAANGRPVSLRIPEDLLVRVVSSDSHVLVINSDVVFVGYGIVAPEIGWDDYAGLDVRGKSVVVLPGEPPPSLLAQAGRRDTTIFRGRERSFHGSARAKREQALTHGAAALIAVRGPEQGDGWSSLLPLFTHEYAAVDSDLRREDPVYATIQWTGLQRLFAAAGRSSDSLLRQATLASFKPFAIGATASFDIVLQHRTLSTHNVIARLTGSDPTLRSEYVIYSAHWDAFGRDTSLAGDQIRNGAADNAIGVAQMLEIAGAFARLPRRPARTIIFLATTAEELGLLGARAYALNPLYPLTRTLAEINLDMAQPWGQSTAVTNIGEGRSTLDEVVRTVAAERGKGIEPDMDLEEGYYFRSDHFEFARVGVPSLMIGSSGEILGKPIGYLRRKDDEYGARDYHGPTDEVHPDWNLAGDAELARINFLVGLRVAQGTRRPMWKDGAEFKAVRDSMLANRPDRLP
jgi:Peptidase family M28